MRYVKLSKCSFILYINTYLYLILMLICIPCKRSSLDLVNRSFRLGLDMISFGSSHVRINKIRFGFGFEFESSYFGSVDFASVDLWTNKLFLQRKKNFSGKY